jgi:hypothetical protein
MLVDNINSVNPLLQLGNGEMKSRTDGTDPGLIEIPEGIMERAKIK